jgi:DNA repair exonuclease SbcCD ATPase subunit
MRKQEIITRIEEIKEELRTFEIDQSKWEESYKDLIDESGPVMICGMNFTASRIIEELDPIAYLCGLDDYVDSLEVSEDDDYKALEAELAELESELADLEEMEELE